MGVGRVYRTKVTVLACIKEIALTFCVKHDIKMDLL